MLTRPGHDTQGRVSALLISLLLLLSLGFSVKANIPSPMTTQAKLNHIADHYQKSLFNYRPEWSMFWGEPDAALDRFMDHSLTALTAWQQQEDEFLSELQALDENHLKNTPEYITYQLLKETLQNNIAMRVCHEELWSLHPLMGWHNILAMLAEKQPVGTPAYRALALKRWRTFDTVVNDEIANLKTGLQAGYTAPKPVVERVLKQLQTLTHAPIEQSPYFEFAKRDGDPQFKKQVAQLIEQEINPALNHFAQFLEKQYLPHARDKIGIAALPSGAKAYQAAVRKETTLDIPPQEIYEYGLQHMQVLQQEIAAIGQREFGKTAMVDVFHQAKTGAPYLFHSEQEILDYNQAALAKAKTKMLAWFTTLPTTPAIIKPYPLFRAKSGAAGEYHPPSIDGKRPGIFYINTYEPTKRSRADQEATLYHELIPGHHYQISLAQETLKGHHNLNKYLWNAGYGEGWALYTERLADEMGLYQDNISRLGMLSNEALRTARLVVDPGIHVMGWTRQQAVDYLKQHTAMDENIIEGEVDRYIMSPGQATAYMLGKREIEHLRQFAQEKLGNAFDIREYHHQVLKNGAVTLPMLKTQIENWVTEQNSKS